MTPIEFLERKIELKKQYLHILSDEIVNLGKQMNVNRHLVSKTNDEITEFESQAEVLREVEVGG